MMDSTIILWRRLDCPGHDCARLSRTDTGWRLAGTAVFADEHGPSRLNYEVLCTEQWHTISGTVEGWINHQDVAIRIIADPSGRWLLNGVEFPEVAGCIDLDLGFTPATNLISIRRLGLETGNQADIRVAWLGLPAPCLEPLDQLYRRISDARYYYESAGGEFIAELHTNEADFVTIYPTLWEMETTGATNHA